MHYYGTATARGKSPRPRLWSMRWLTKRVEVHSRAQGDETPSENTSRRLSRVAGNRCRRPGHQQIGRLRLQHNPPWKQENTAGGWDRRKTHRGASASPIFFSHACSCICWNLTPQQYLLGICHKRVVVVSALPPKHVGGIVDCGTAVIVDGLVTIGCAVVSEKKVAPAPAIIPAVMRCRSRQGCGLIGRGKVVPGAPQTWPWRVGLATRAGVHCRPSAGTFLFFKWGDGERMRDG